jgi:putative ABC transport system ATP-binding protein
MSTPDSDVLVECAGVGRVFGSGSSAVVAVHDVTATVPAGARIAVVGPSGSGKSTLLHLMAGLDRPTQGVVSWPAFGASPARRPLLAGVVFQGPSLVPALDVAENVALPLLLAGMAADEAATRAAEALRRLDLDHISGQLPEELSGGQAQRVAMARVLACRPRLVLADEPTGQLDRATAAHVVDVLIDVVDEIGAGLIVATHDNAVAGRLAQTWFMRDGALPISETASSGAGS